MTRARAPSRPSTLRIVKAEDFGVRDLGVLKTLRKPVGNPAQYKQKPVYYDIVCAFDIETTYLEPEDESIMYIWQFAFGERLVVYGRTWESWEGFAAKLRRLPYTFVVYVHNLSFEFQFLAGIWNFEKDAVFCVKSRKVLKASYYNIEFRCSYLHSNMSLAKYIEHVGGDYPKLELDYTEVRYPWTELSDNVLEYSFRDVYGLTNAIRHEMESDGDTLYTIPLTSTGYLRRECKEALQPKRKMIQGLRCEYDVQRMLHLAFRGGDTHANRRYTGYILEDVKSCDRSSSYPDVMVNDLFPVKPFQAYGFMLESELQDVVLGKAFFGSVCISGIRLKSDLEPAPYVSISKCQVFVNALEDNGRIIEAEYIETVITDIDYKIMCDMYVWDSLVVRTGFVSDYGYLPEEFRDIIRKYYTKKTSLKGVEGQEYFYVKSKNKANSGYGMTAQDPCKDTYKYDYREAGNSQGGFVLEEYTRDDWIKASRKYWLHYAWGVWVPALARLRLHEGRRLVQDQTEGLGWVYCDTDCNKYIGNVDWTAYNAERKRISEQNGAYAVDLAGVTHYMGVYEVESTSRLFRTWGAKKYASIDKKGLHLTVSGVNKMLGAEELVKKARISRHLHGGRTTGLDIFRPGFVFVEGGGNELKYDDTIDKTIKIDGHSLRITRNVSIKPSTYELTISPDYQDVIRYDTIENLSTLEVLEL